MGFPLFSVELPAVVDQTLVYGFRTAKGSAGGRAGEYVGGLPATTAMTAAW